ncbi:MAG: protein-L-isoaspartate(D-aspartate) O-methyltransferase [Acidimicrobiia bacterium]
MESGDLGAGDSFGGYRSQLVEILRGKGITDLAVLKAVSEVPRHLFVPASVRHRAYEDSALPIGQSQTISQPFVQATYLQALQLKGEEKVLEVGTGSGYQTALLARLAAMVFSIERHASLAQQAKDTLTAAGVTNVSIMVGDGTLGWRPYAPYDAILVSAASPDIPQPLLEQLSDGGRLVIPIGGRDTQRLIMVVRRGDEYIRHKLADVRFVPLVGELGYEE